MALSGTLETVLELKASPEKFYNVLRSTSHQVPNITPTNIQAVEVREGDWETAGSVRFWNYTIEGKKEVYKEKIEFDDEKKTLSLVGLEGDVFKQYKVYKPIWHLTPKGEGSLAKCAIEYERLSEKFPPPTKYLDFMITVTKDIDKHLAAKASSA